MNKLTSKIENQEYPNIHSVLVAKNGKVYYEKYFQGKDQVFGKDIGVVQHSEITLHDLRSVTKSVISICIGIALDKGILKSVDQKIYTFFPELEFLFIGEKANWTIQDFLSMTTGLEWNEEVPYDELENDEVQMTYSQDPIYFVLSKPLESKPGEKFNYNGGATQVLAQIIERSSNTPLDQFAKEHLFDCIGIGHFEWTKLSFWDGADQFAASSGLRLTSPDLMKFALLLRNNGEWNNKQVVSSSWLKEAFIHRKMFPSTVAEGNDAFGYQFWMWIDLIQNNEFKMLAAIGNGGQNIFLDYKNDIVVVTTAGNYNQRNTKNDPYALLKNEIYPALLDKKLISKDASNHPIDLNK